MCHGSGEEGAESMPKKLKASPEMVAQFDKLDTDHSGELSVKELRALDMKASNPECVAEVTSRCADEDGSGFINMVEFNDMHAPDGPMNDYKMCLSLMIDSCRKAAKTKPEVEYRPQLCKELFAYKNTRTKCMRLQPRICGKDCAQVFTEGQADCQALQKTICYVPKLGPQPQPLDAGPIPEGDRKVTTTVCIA